MFEKPLTFTEAADQLSSRLDTPTAMKHKEIASVWNADFRRRAFFSARVTDATVLSELHGKVAAVLDGKMTGKQAVSLLRQYFVGPGADPLGQMGFSPKDSARSIADLASLPRLELIIETNVRMAQECGHYQQWAESAAYFRYGVWRCGYAKEHREEHLARDGKVYAFEHPIWTQSPPGGEFNCNCRREIASEEDIQGLGLTPEPLSSPFVPSSLGFDPSHGMSEPPPIGKRVRPEYEERTQQAIKEYDEVDNRTEQAEIDAIKEEWGEIMDEAEASYAAQEAAAQKRREAAKKGAATRKANKLAAKEALTQEKQSEPEAPATVFPKPEDLPELQIIGSPGGSTGAKIVQDKDGNQFIRKTGGIEGGEPEEHLRNECAADSAYQATGVKVPEFRLYETKEGPVKLATFIPDAQPLNTWWDVASEKDRQIMREKMRDGFDADVVFGNWDVAGELADNILIDKDGTPWRIDNGGALGFRAQGKRKDEKDWASGWPDDLFTMPISPNNKRFFADLTPRVLAESIAGRNWTPAVEKMTPADQSIVAKRLKEIREMDVRGRDFIQSGYTGEYADRILVHSYNLSKEGFREEAPAQIFPGYWGSCRSGTPTGAPVNPEKEKEADFKNKILSAVKTVNHHNSDAGDKKPNMQTLHSALSIKPELEALAQSGNAGAQHYLDQLNIIEQAAKSGSTVPILSMKHEVFTAPEQIKQASKYVSLTDHIHDYMKRNGGDTQFIIKWQDDQAGSSYSYKACELKVVHLRAMGIDSISAAKKAGYFMGTKNSTQAKNIKDAFSRMTNNQQAFDRYHESYAQYKASVQLLLEKTDFVGRDPITRTVILGRTEDVGSVIKCDEGSLSNHARGPSESHFIFNTVVVHGDGATVLRVPYSRVNGVYFLERTPGHNDSMFLGDSENEFNIDSHGLPALYLGRVHGNIPIDLLRDKFLQFERDHLN